jgi:hypothetical protein
MNNLLFLSLALVSLLMIAPPVQASRVHTPTKSTSTTPSPTITISQPATHANENCCAVTAKLPPVVVVNPGCNGLAGGGGGPCGTPTPTPQPTPQPTPTPSAPTKTPTNSSDNNGCPVGYYRPFPGLGNYYACQINPSDTGSKCFLPAVEDKNGRCSIPPNSPPQPNAVYNSNGRCMNCAPLFGNNNSKTIPINPQTGIVGGLIK